MFTQCFCIRPSRTTKFHKHSLSNTQPLMVYYFPADLSKLSLSRTSFALRPKSSILHLMIRPFNQTYNMSIWHVALRGVDSPDSVQRAYQDYYNVRRFVYRTLPSPHFCPQFRESVAMRLILKHLRRKGSSAYQVLLEETGIQIENPSVQQIHVLCFAIC